MGCTICRGLIPGYTHCFSCFCDQVTDKKQFKEENVGFGLQFQEDILHHTEEGMVVITFHLQSASRVNKKRHRKPQGPCRSDLLTPVRLPPPKGSTIFQNRATSGEPKTQANGGHFTFKAQLGKLESGIFFNQYY